MLQQLSHHRLNSGLVTRGNLFKSSPVISMPKDPAVGVLANCSVLTWYFPYLGAPR